MPSLRRLPSRRRAAAARHWIGGAALLAVLAAGPASAAAPAWHPLHAGDLEVTEGALAPAGAAALRTGSPKLRAVHRDGGRHATRALLIFRGHGDSTTVEPLGSGAIRRQIGLKLRATDPCNLLYVMWRSVPEHAVVVSVKRNPGQTTSAQCGNRGYTDLATIPLAGRSASDQAAHRLDVRTRRTAGGTMLVSLRLDGGRPRGLAVPAPLASGLAGPVGVRSDNGTYTFRLAAGR